MVDGPRTTCRRTLLEFQMQRRESGGFARRQQDAQVDEVLPPKIRAIIFHNTIFRLFPTRRWSDPLVESVFLAIDSVDSPEAPEVSSHLGTGIDGVRPLPNYFRCRSGVHGKFLHDKIVSYALAGSVIYCVYQAWYFASIQKDIPKHKYWSMRLVGYLQTITIQRVAMVLLVVLHRTGLFGLYPAYEENDEATMEKIFEDSFVLCYITALLLTEWYLAGYYGWTKRTEMPKDGNK